MCEDQRTTFQANRRGKPRRSETPFPGTFVPKKRKPQRLLIPRYNEAPPFPPPAFQLNQYRPPIPRSELIQTRPERPQASRSDLRRNRLLLPRPEFSQQIPQFARFEYNPGRPPVPGFQFNQLRYPEPRFQLGQSSIFDANGQRYQPTHSESQEQIFQSQLPQLQHQNQNLVFQTNQQNIPLSSQTYLQSQNPELSTFLLPLSIEIPDQQVSGIQINQDVQDTALQVQQQTNHSTQFQQSSKVQAHRTNQETQIETASTILVGAQLPTTGNGQQQPHNSMTEVQGGYQVPYPLHYQLSYQVPALQINQSTPFVGYNIQQDGFQTSGFQTNQQGIQVSGAQPAQQFTQYTQELLPLEITRQSSQQSSLQNQQFQPLQYTQLPQVLPPNQQWPFHQGPLQTQPVIIFPSYCPNVQGNINIKIGVDVTTSEAVGQKGDIALGLQHIEQEQLTETCHEATASKMSGKQNKMQVLEVAPSNKLEEILQPMTQQNVEGNYRSQPQELVTLNVVDDEKVEPAHPIQDLDQVERRGEIPNSEYAYLKPQVPVPVQDDTKFEANISRKVQEENEIWSRESVSVLTEQSNYSTEQDIENLTLVDKSKVYENIKQKVEIMHPRRNEQKSSSQDSTLVQLDCNIQSISQIYLIGRTDTNEGSLKSPTGYENQRTVTNLFQNPEHLQLDREQDLVSINYENPLQQSTEIQNENEESQLNKQQKLASINCEGYVSSRMDEKNENGSKEFEPILTEKNNSNSEPSPDSPENHKLVDKNGEEENLKQKLEDKSPTRNEQSDTSEDSMLVQLDSNETYTNEEPIQSEDEYETQETVRNLFHNPEHMQSDKQQDLASINYGNPLQHLIEVQSENEQSQINRHQKLASINYEDCGSRRMQEKNKIRSREFEPILKEQNNYNTEKGSENHTLVDGSAEEDNVKQKMEVKSPRRSDTSQSDTSQESMLDQSDFNEMYTIEEPIQSEAKYETRGNVKDQFHNPKNVQVDRQQDICLINHEHPLQLPTEARSENEHLQINRQQELTPLYCEDDVFRRIQEENKFRSREFEKILTEQINCDTEKNPMDLIIINRSGDDEKNEQGTDVNNPRRTEQGNTSQECMLVELDFNVASTSRNVRVDKTYKNQRVIQSEKEYESKGSLTDPFQNTGHLQLNSQQKIAPRKCKGNVSRSVQEENAIRSREFEPILEEQSGYNTEKFPQDFPLVDKSGNFKQRIEVKSPRISEQGKTCRESGVVQCDFNVPSTSRTCRTGETYTHQEHIQSQEVYETQWSVTNLFQNPEYLQQNLSPINNEYPLQLSTKIRTENEHLQLDRQQEISPINYEHSRQFPIEIKTKNGGAIHGNISTASNSPRKDDDQSGIISDDSYGELKIALPEVMSSELEDEEEEDWPPPTCSTGLELYEMFQTFLQVNTSDVQQPQQDEGHLTNSRTHEITLHRFPQITICPLGMHPLSFCPWNGFLDERKLHVFKSHWNQLSCGTLVNITVNSSVMTYAFHEFFLCYTLLEEGHLYCVMQHACYYRPCFSAFEYTCSIRQEDGSVNDERRCGVATMFQSFDYLKETGKCVKYESLISSRNYFYDPVVLFNIIPPLDF